LKRVIIDVDTGGDDAQAMLLALGSPEIKVEALTSVMGNTDLEATTINTLHVVEVAAQQIPAATGVPVAKGLHRPLVRPYPKVGLSHAQPGRTFTSSLGLPPPERKLHSKHAVDLIIDTVMANPGDITLMPVGPMTNIAMAILKEPTMVDAVDEVITMGGAFQTTPYGMGNTTAVSEFNWWCDPEAVKIVLESGLKVTAIGLDVTVDPANSMTSEHLQKFEPGNPVDDMILGLNQGVERWGYQHIYDVIAAGVAIDPSIATVESLHIDMVTMVPEDDVARGQSIADRRRRREGPEGRIVEPPMADVVTAIDTKKFWDLYVNTLSSKKR
jgi:purine nucleosidase